MSGLSAHVDVIHLLKHWNLTIISRTSFVLQQIQLYIQISHLTMCFASFSLDPRIINFLQLLNLLCQKLWNIVNTVKPSKICDHVSKDLESHVKMTPWPWRSWPWNCHNLSSLHVFCGCCKEGPANTKSTAAKIGFSKPNSCLPNHFQEISFWEKHTRFIANFSTCNTTRTSFGSSNEHAAALSSKFSCLRYSPIQKTLRRVHDEQT